MSKMFAQSTDLLLNNAYLGLALLLITVGYVKSGKMGMILFPKVESDYAFCEIYLPYHPDPCRFSHRAYPGNHCR